MRAKGRRNSTTGGEDTAVPARTDDELMLAARQGELGAFDALVRRHQHRALLVASRYLGEASLAQDVAQSAFLEVYRGLDRYRAGGRFPGFLYAVLLNQCRMVRRTQAYEARARRAVAVEEPPQPTAGPEAAAQRRQRRGEVDRAVGQLSDKLRAVVVLRFAGDLSYQEIADALHVPLGTVKRRLFDGVQRLRRLVRQEEEE